MASLDVIILEFCDSINSILLMQQLLIWAVLAAFGGNNVGVEFEKARSLENHIEIDK